MTDLRDAAGPRAAKSLVPDTYRRRRDPKDDDRHFSRLDAQGGLALDRTLHPGFSVRARSSAVMALASRAWWPGNDVRLRRRIRRRPRDRRDGGSRMTSFSLAHLTVLNVPPPEMVRVAARTGYDCVGLRMIAVTDATPGYPLMHEPAMMRDTKAALADTGVRVLDIEFVKITPEIDVAGLERFVAAGAELGAKHVITAPYDPDLTRLADRLGAFSDLSARYGLRAVLEFFPWTVVPDLDAAVQMVEAAGRTETGILVDTLHFDRSGSRVEQLDRIPPARLPFVHVCDAPVQNSYTTEELLHAGRAERLPPWRGRHRYWGHPASHAAGHTGRAGGADDGDERCRGCRSRRAPGASSGRALTGSLTSRTHYPVSARLPDGPLLFELRAEPRHWERQSPGNRVAARFRRKTVHQTRVCKLERIRRYHRDHTEFGFLSCALRWQDRAQICSQCRHNNCQGFSEKTHPRNACLRPY